MMMMLGDRNKIESKKENIEINSVHWIIETKSTTTTKNLLLKKTKLPQEFLISITSLKSKSYTKMNEYIERAIRWMFFHFHTRFLRGGWKADDLDWFANDNNDDDDGHCHCKMTTFEKFFISKIKCWKKFPYENHYFERWYVWIDGKHHACLFSLWFGLQNLPLFLIMIIMMMMIIVWTIIIHLIVFNICFSVSWFFTNLEKHKSYHVRDEQLARDGFKKFLKHETCPFDDCRSSRVCNHIHCVRSGKFSDFQFF